MYQSINQSICLSICLLEFYLPIYLSICLSTDPCIHPSIHPFIHPSINLSVYLSICLSRYLDIYMYIYIYVYVYMYADEAPLSGSLLWPPSSDAQDFARASAVAEESLLAIRTVAAFGGEAAQAARFEKELYGQGCLLWLKALLTLGCAFFAPSK